MFKNIPFLLTTLLLTACSTTPVIQPDARGIQLSPKRALQDIPYFPQIEDQCGPASLATMLAVRDIDVSPEVLRGKIYIPGKEGTVTTEIIARARQYGLLAYTLEPELIDLLKEVDAGNPVLVMQNLAYNWLPRWHFSVVVAYDLNKQTLSLRSGDEVRHEIGFDLFVKTWRRAKSWAVVIMPPNHLPATANETRAIQAVSELEQVGQTMAAYTAYQTVIKQWSDNSLAYFGAGNVAYKLGDYTNAEQLFSSYLQLQPTATAGWNNLAYTLVKNGCLKQAKQAIQCAIKIEPDNETLIESYHEIDAFSLTESDTSCPQKSCPVSLD